MPALKEPRRKKSELDVKYTLKVYWSFLKKHKVLMVSTMFFTLLMTLCGYITRYLFKLVVDKGALFTSNAITVKDFSTFIIALGGIWTIVLIVSSSARWFRIHFLNLLEVKLMRDLRQTYYNHIMRLSHGFHTTHKTGSLISRLIRGSSAMERLTDFVTFQTLPLIFELMVSGISLAAISWKIGLTFMVFALVFVTLSAKLQKQQRKANVIMNTNEDIEKAMTSDTFTNIDSIKYYGKENLMMQKYARLSGNTSNALLRQWEYSRWSSSLESLIISVGGLCVLFLALQGFLAAAITLGTVTFAWTLYNSLIDSTARFMDGLRGYHRSMADFHDLFQYGKIENDIKDEPGAKQMEVKNGEIQFKNISFGYHRQHIFKNLSLHIPKNKKVALVGHSGSGKSTIIKLLYRLYNLEEGQILIDKTDIKNVKQESLRSELSIVPQDCILFDDTIYNNIKFSKPNATRKEVMQAIKFAQLDKVIANFPYEENTIVGERGVKLSGGEKQRVSIARAILADKKILVLDEATSSLDSKTEYEIQKDLQNLMKNRTSLIIAHRLSTIMSADIIVVLDKGKIVQQGTHRELISKPGVYKELWNLQKGGYL